MVIKYFCSLIVGLLKPKSGEVYIDDSKIDDVLQSWHNQISYVHKVRFY